MNQLSLDVVVWAGVLVIVSLALASAVVAYRDRRRAYRQAMDALQPLAELMVDSDLDDPEPVVRIIRPRRPCRWQRKPTKRHGRRMFPIPC